MIVLQNYYCIAAFERITFNIHGQGCHWVRIMDHLVHIMDHFQLDHFSKIVPKTTDGPSGLSQLRLSEFAQISFRFG